jgi:membrane protein involved in colicin uptake
LAKYEDQLKSAGTYSKFYEDAFEPNKMNTLPTCKSGSFADGSDVANLATDIANRTAELSDKLTVLAAEETRRKAEAEAKAKAEAEAKAKAEAEAKAKVEAEARAKVEAAKKKTTITCVKGKLTKKVTAINPKCPAGYKKK